MKYKPSLCFIQIKFFISKELWLKIKAFIKINTLCLCRNLIKLKPFIIKKDIFTTKALDLNRSLLYFVLRRSPLFQKSSDWKSKHLFYKNTYCLCRILLKLLPFIIKKDIFTTKAFYLNRSLLYFVLRDEVLYFKRVLIEIKAFVL